METQMMQNRNGKINIVLNDKKEVKTAKRSSEHSMKNSPFMKIDQELSSFVAMEELKTTIKEIYATMMMNAKRKQAGLKDTRQVLHMLFRGNPGTGKTTVARKLAKIYFEMNLLSKGHFIEVERADLVGEYIGQTAQKTRAMVQKAMGGILFIDEAYSLARGGEKDFGKEAIDTLVKHMEDNHNDFVLILAGYPNEMDRFLSLNPGLKSRFPFILDFDDYSVSHLMEIARQMAAEREYKLSREAEWELRSQLLRTTALTVRNFANARYVRNVIETAIRKHAVRLLGKEDATPAELMELSLEDVQAEGS
ncbi:stage V sporulation protein K [Lentibacillus sediminis]|uniref:stage V sporulation protein K n=1 Tax=Lentibacillus sediminis TaxID=1940529 RepID=UPI000C1B89EF|nr:stage V sporulation protein K [Lentibacillus sediminis]